MKKKLKAILLDEKNSNFTNEININDKEDIIFVSNKNISTLIEQKNLFIEIINPKFKRYSYQEIITIYINSIIEIGMIESVYNFEIYKSIEDYMQNNSMDLIIKEIYYINPIVVINKNMNLINYVNEYFKVSLKEQDFINKYSKTRLIYTNKNFKILKSIFFKRNIEKYSLEYFHIKDFIKFRDIILLSLIWKIPINFKKSIRIFLLKKIAKKNDEDVYKSIFTQAYRNKVLFYKYVKIFK